MQKGHRSVHRFCRCGCGEEVPPYISPKTGRVAGYRPFIAGHGNKDWGRRWAKRLAENGNPLAKPEGSKQITSHGYIRIKCSDGKWRYEHRVIANAGPGEVVHHKNHSGLDNNPENLSVLQPAEHARLHFELPAGQWSIKFTACIVCSKTERRHAAQGKCDRCYQKNG
jgi:hypothetical protein